MAQAARLNLRMQKELKLLLTDPPPGASFPFLTADLDLSSLSTIDAQIEGPEGTVYAKGFFNIKIQIPERYPFQPPSVTFGTPIYHPNIDNGGRICLDILNLPPKGAWQPSLNISTVLTSIGLLLSEPNPDDGLMCEASREYKYNRQVFDQKARAMTEKYAKAGVSKQTCRTPSLQTVEEAEKSERESKHEVNYLISSDNKPCKISRKLSLEPLSSTHKRASDGEASNAPNLLKPGFENTGAKERSKLTEASHKCNLRYDDLHGSESMRCLSLQSSVGFDKRDGDDMQNGDAKHSHLLCTAESHSSAALGSSLPQGGSFLEPQHQPHNQKSNCYSKITSLENSCKVRQKIFPGLLNAFQTSGVENENKLVTPTAQPSQSHSSFSKTCQDIMQKKEDGSIDAEKKKLCSGRKKLSLGFNKSLSEGGEKHGKENVLPMQNLPNLKTQRVEKKTQIGQKLSMGPLTQLQGRNEENSQLLLHARDFSVDKSQKQQSSQHQSDKSDWRIEECEEESPVAESVIVLDSEDSEDENNRSIRSKLSLVRKRIGKRKTQA